MFCHIYGTQPPSDAELIKKKIIKKNYNDNQNYLDISQQREIRWEEEKHLKGLTKCQGKKKVIKLIENTRDSTKWKNIAANAYQCHTLIVLCKWKKKKNKLIETIITGDAGKGALQVYTCSDCCTHITSVKVYT